VWVSSAIYIASKSLIKPANKPSHPGATTLGKMTFSITTLSIKKYGITPLHIITFSITVDKMRPSAL